QEGVRFLRLLGRGGLARADRPHRLVGDHPVVGSGRGGDGELPLEDLERASGVPFLAGLAQAEDRPQAVASGGLELARHDAVALVVVLPPLAVTDQHPRAAGVAELRAGDVAGVRALVVAVEVLAAEADARARERLGDRGQERERREDGDVAGGRHLGGRRAGGTGALAETGPQRGAEGARLARQQVHLPVRRRERRARRRAPAHERSTSTPGSGRPASSSSEAPPPVETWEIRSAAPAWWTAATVSPPPMTL